MSVSTIRLQLEEVEIQKAHQLARQWGFSSVEEALKEFIKRFLNKTVTASLVETEYIKLSKKTKARYVKMEQDFKIGKDVRITHSVDEFIAQLHA